MKPGEGSEKEIFIFTNELFQSLLGISLNDSLNFNS